MHNFKNKIYPNDNCLKQLLNRTVEEYQLETETPTQTAFPILHFSQSKQNRTLKYVELEGFKRARILKITPACLKTTK